MRKYGFILFFALGFFSLLAQVLVIREFILSFGGNELGIGLFYFFWFIWVALGSLVGLGRLGEALKRHFLRLMPLYPVLGWAELLLFINLKSVAGINWWELFLIDRVFIYLFLFTSFVSFFTGFIFTVGAAWLKEKEESAPRLIAHAFLWESLGSVAAGGLVTFLSYRSFSPIISLMVSSLFFMLAVLWVSIKFRDRSAVVINLISASIFIILFFHQGVAENIFNRMRMNNFLPQAKFKAQVYTPYRHILVGELTSQIAVTADGELLVSMPDIVDADTQAVLFMAQADNPHKILICGTGAENLIVSLLRFPVERIVYLAEDRVYYETIMAFAPPTIKAGLADRRLDVIFDPSRQFLRTQKDKFGLAVIYYSNPVTLSANAYFTDDFYRLLYKNIEPDGVVAVPFKGAENFISTDKALCGGALYRTLEKVFSQIVLMPGSVNWFFAGSGLSRATDDADILQQRVDDKIPYDFSFRAQGLTALFLPDRVKYARKSYLSAQAFDGTDIINTDNNPKFFFLNLIALTDNLASWPAALLKGALPLTLIFFLAPLFIFFIFRVLFLWRVPRPLPERLIFNARIFQFFSGFCGFSLQLLLIYLFQIRFSTIFSLIGLVSGLFMLGLCAGALLGGRLAVRVRAEFAVCAVLALQFVILAAVYFLLIGRGVNSFAVYGFFFVFAGILTGISYPLAAHLLAGTGMDISRTAVYLELCDHLGAAVAGILCGLFLVPIIGISGVLQFILFANIFLLLLFILELIPVMNMCPVVPARAGSFPWTGLSYAMAALVVSCVICSKVAVHHRIAPGVTILARGFGGEMALMMRVDRDGSIENIELGENKETTAYIKDMPRFLAQFKGRRLDEGFMLNRDLDAISGATISSQAIVDALNKYSFNRQPENERKLFSFGRAAALLLFFILFLIIYYHRSRWTVLRPAYLLLTVLFLGLFSNTLISSFHLSHILDFDFFPLSPVIITAGLVTLLSLLFGPVWCGWFCPFGALQELLSFSFLRRTVSKPLDQQARFFKYILLCLFIVCWFFKCEGLFAYEPLNNFFAHNSFFTKGRVIGLLALCGSIFFLRFWCRYFCICGAFLALFNKIALLRRFSIKYYHCCPMHVTHKDDIDCIQCNLCLSLPSAVRRPASDRLFMAFFAFMLFISVSIVLLDLSASGKTAIRSMDKHRSYEQMQKAPVEKIIEMIAAGKLSDHEAMYYKKTEI